MPRVEYLLLSFGDDRSFLLPGFWLLSFPIVTNLLDKSRSLKSHCPRAVSMRHGLAPQPMIRLDSCKCSDYFKQGAAVGKLLSGSTWT